MVAMQQTWSYGRRPPLVLVNGLAEQAETWYRNTDVWRQRFDVHQPNFLVYDGLAVQRRIEADQPIDVDYFVEQLRLYIESFVQSAPVFLVANSMGGKIAVELAVRHPQLIAKLALLCPSGLSEDERLPIVEGVRRSDPETLVRSVFEKPESIEPGLLAFYAGKFASRRWRSGILQTIRGTMQHRVTHLLGDLEMPTLLVVGEKDRIVDPQQAIAATRKLKHGKLVVLPECGHAPQIEDADLINDLVAEFLLAPAAGASHAA
jgi:pimeloyl-ACP methyl ester carboxylesterase